MLLGRDSSRFKVTNLTSWPFWILRPRAHHCTHQVSFLTWISQPFHNLSDGHRSLQLFFSTSNAKMIGPMLCLCVFSRAVHSLEDDKTQLKFAVWPSPWKSRKFHFSPAKQYILQVCSIFALAHELGSPRLSTLINFIFLAHMLLS